MVLGKYYEDINDAIDDNEYMRLSRVTKTSIYQKSDYPIYSHVKIMPKISFGINGEYQFAQKNEYRAILEIFCKLLYELQYERFEFFKYEIRLMGGRGGKLALQNQTDKVIHLDYIFIVKNIKRQSGAPICDNPLEIEFKIKSCIERIANKNGVFYTNTSTSSMALHITTNLGIKGVVNILIISEDEQANYYRISNISRGSWKKINHSNNALKKFIIIREKCWVKFKQKYLSLKNKYISDGKNIDAFLLFIWAVNYFKQQTSELKT